MWKMEAVFLLESLRMAFIARRVLGYMSVAFGSMLFPRVAAHLLAPKPCSMSEEEVQTRVAGTPRAGVHQGPV